MADTYDIDTALARIAAAASLDDLRAIEHELVGKRSEIAALHTRLGALPAEERKAAGQRINELGSTLTAAIAQRRAAIEEGDSLRSGSTSPRQFACPASGATPVGADISIS